MKRSLGLSLFLHAILALALWARDEAWIESDAPLSPTLQVRTLNEKQLTRELRDALEKDERQIVQGDDQMAEDEPPPERLGKQFLSKHNQRVDHETHAARVGRFQNVLKEGLEHSGPETKSGTQAHPHEAVNRLFQLARTESAEAREETVEPTGRLRAPASVDGPTGQGQSATDDYLKDIAIGANTLLNTREFKFYGFYERIREKVSYQWHMNLEQSFDLTLDRMPNSEQTTIIQVRLDAEGQLTLVKILSSSGIPELDRAATDAFRQASPFPNPPTDMLNSQKAVVLRWDFVVVADGSAGVQVRVRRSTW